MVVFVVKRYAVREAEKWRYAVRMAKIGRYAVRKGGGGVTLMGWTTLQTRQGGSLNTRVLRNGSRFTWTLFKYKLYADMFVYFDIAMYMYINTSVN